MCVCSMAEQADCALCFDTDSSAVDKDSPKVRWTLEEVSEKKTLFNR